MRNPPQPWVPQEKQAKIEVPPNQFPQLEESVTSLLASHYCRGKSHWLLVNQSEDTATGVLRQGELNSQRAEERVQAGQGEGDSSSPGSPEPPHVVALPLGFKKVMACL